MQKVFYFYIIRL